MSEDTLYVNGEPWPHAFTINSSLCDAPTVVTSQVTPAPVIAFTLTCDGPGCQHIECYSQPDAWYRLYRGISVFHHFCSSRCLANWLATVLAQEEDTL